MIKLVFAHSREYFRVIIEGREIFYSDKTWKRPVRLIPTDEHFQKKIIMSRNQIPAHIINMFNLTKEEQKEYDSAKTEEALANICIFDVKKKGASLLKKEIVEI